MIQPDSAFVKICFNHLLELGLFIPKNQFYSNFHKLLFFFDEIYLPIGRQVS